MNSNDSNPQNKKNFHGLGSILSTLIEECDINEAGLSRETGVPAATISRLRNDPDVNPTIATLMPIAKFFSISISQLLGDEPLPLDRLPGTYNSLGFTSARMPVINWEHIVEWIKDGGTSIKSSLTNWISTEKEVGSKAFALIVPTESFGLAFRKGSMIIIDPEREPQDGDIILVQDSSQNNEIILRLLLKDGGDFYIRSINPEMKSTKLLTAEYTILGVTIETRFSLQEDAVKPKALEKAAKLSPAFLPLRSKLHSA